MYHYFDTVTNTRGDSLLGYYARVRLPASEGGSIAPIFSDENGTPLVGYRARTDSTGFYDFWVANGTYTLEILSPTGAITKVVPNVTMLPAGPQGNPGGNAMAIGLLADASGLTIPDGFDLVIVSGDTVVGDLTAGMRLAYDEAVDAAYVAANPSTSFVDAAGRGFRKADDAYLLEANDAIIRTVPRKLADTIAVEDFGAKCDKVTDDRDAWQAAIDWCNATPTAKTITVNGPSRVSGPLFINRRVDTKGTMLTIEGQGGGFYFTAGSAFTLFESGLSFIGGVVGEPNSELVTFRGLSFEQANADDEMYTISKKFLRYNFESCCWYRMKFAKMLVAPDATGYIQSLTINNCYMQRWKGTWLTAPFVFDVNLRDNRFEKGVHGVNISNAFRLTWTGGTFEGCTGSALKLSGGLSVKVEGVYLETNTGPDFIFADVMGGGQISCVEFTNNWMIHSEERAADPDDFNVIVGSVRKMTSGSNVCTMRLFDDSATLGGELVSTGDLIISADLSEGNITVSDPFIKTKTGRPIEVLPSDVRTYQAIAATGTNVATAAAVNASVVHVTGGALDTGVVVPAAFDWGGKCLGTLVINTGPNRIRIYVPTTDLINGALGFVSLEPGAQREIVAVTSGGWVG